MVMAGCGGAATVSGKVTYQGRSVTFGSVVFLSADQTARSGMIMPDGSYTVEAVPAGEVKIGVISPDPATSRAIGHMDATARHFIKGRSTQKITRAGWFALPKNFERPENSGISTTVPRGQYTFDIDLR
jgi:hypothetical protein